MNNSDLYHQIARHLYYYRNQSTNLLRSRTYAVGKTLKTVIKTPLRYSKKLIVLLFTDPARLYAFATGRRLIQRHEEFQQELKLRYQEWIKQNTLTPKQLKEQQKQSQLFKKKPLVSLVTPVWNPPVDAHVKLIDSVLNQSYQHFELLLFNFGDKPEVEDLLNEYAKKDKRIIVKHGMKNKGIGENSNYCLDYVKGDFVGLLDHDDALEPDALYECIKAYNEQDTDFIYTDKDKISEEDVRFDPFCKPDWSPEMALGGNYMTHFNLMRTSLVKKLGGWDSTTDGAQDWDLFLRISVATKKPIVHVPKILYHWRTVASSTAGGVGVKPYVINAQQKAVNKHLKSLSADAVAQHDKHGQLNVHWNKRHSTSFVIHALYHDIGHVIDNIKNLQVLKPNDVDYQYFVVAPDSDRFSKDEERKLKKLGKNVTLKTYNTGNLQGVLQALDVAYEKTIFMVDSIKKIHNTADNAEWVDQLVGWLTLDGVAIVGGASSAENGQLTDIGSFYDCASSSFNKYYFGAGEMSGINGYKQWIRNHTLVSEKLFACDSSLLKSIKGMPQVRDDEVSKLLAIAASASGKRSVYDPTIESIDNAPFDISLGISDELKSIIDSSGVFADASCDPYYNSNLDTAYNDPQLTEQVERTHKTDTWIISIEDLK